MEESNKRIIKNSAYMYIRMVFIMVISLYTSRVVLEILGETDFGIYTLVGGIVSMFTVLSGSLMGGVQRFLNIGLGEGDQEKTKGYFAQSLTIFARIFVAFLIVGESLGLWFVESKLNSPPGREIATRWVYQFSMLAALVSIIQIPFSGAVIARERMGFFALLGIFDVCARLGVVVLMDILGTPDNLIWYAGAIAAIQILQAASYIVFAKARFPECVIRLQWNGKLVKEMLSYIGLSFWGNTMVNLTSQGINVLLNLFGGPVLNAATGIAKQVNVAVLRMVECISTPIRPQILKSYAAGNFGQMILLYERSTKYSVMFMTVLLFPLIIETGFVFDIWLKDVPSYAAVVGATGKIVRMEVYGRFITLAVLPVVYIVLKLGGDPVWTLVISLFAQIIYAFYLFGDMKRKVGIDVKGFFHNVLRPVGILAGVLLLVTIPEVLLIEEGVARFFIVGFTVVIAGGSAVWLWCLDAKEKEHISMLLKLKR